MMHKKRCRPASIVIEGRHYPLRYMDAITARVYSGYLLVDGRPVASLRFDDGQPSEAHLLRAQFALASYRESGGQWSYLGDGQVYQPLSLAACNHAFGLAEHSHYCRHWQLEVEDNSPGQEHIKRWLIWSEALAEAAAQAVLQAGRHG